jgi:hypothetical protein
MDSERAIERMGRIETEPCIYIVKQPLHELTNKDTEEFYDYLAHLIVSGDGSRAVEYNNEGNF